MIHGGDLGEAERLFGRPRQGWLDLSTGINPEPYPVPALPSECWTRLPELRALGDLLRAARRRYGAPAAAGIVAGPGTQAILQALPALLPDRRAATVAPAYGGYADAWGPPLLTLTAPDAEAADILILGQPNNPNGRIWPAARLLDLAERLGRRGGLLIVDEAFADAVPSASVASHAGRPGLLVLRSFGKFFGLAGLRLGFAIGEPSLADKLARRLGAWAVSGPALAIGATALGDQTWGEAATRRLGEDEARLDALLAGAGLAVIGGTPLFRLIETADGGALHRHLAERGVWTRRFDHHPGWLRLGLPGHQGWTRLADALGEWRAHATCPISTSAA